MPEPAACGGGQMWLCLGLELVRRKISERLREANFREVINPPGKKKSQKNQGSK